MNTWLIQSPGFRRNDSAFDEVSNACKQLGINYKMAQLLPFDTKITYDGELTGRVIPYGSTTMISNRYAQNNDVGLFFDPEKFQPTVWVEQRNDMLNSDVRLVKFKDVDQFMNSEHEYFIRPNSDLKTFNGTAIHKKDFVEWRDKILGYCNESELGNFLETPCALSPYKHILAEFRCFVVDAKVVDISMYRRNGVLWKMHIERNEDAYNIYDQADQLCKKFLPMPCVCMDMALTKDGISIIEFNTINGSGFYNHDICAIIAAIDTYVSTL